jgi:hypothetical protein
MLSAAPDAGAPACAEEADGVAFMIDPSPFI